MNREFWLLSDDECDKLNPPPIEFTSLDDGVYVKMLNDDKWLWMGWVPVPRNRFQWFIHHMIHGLWMGYPFIKVFFFALDRRNDSGTSVYEVSE